MAVRGSAGRSAALLNCLDKGDLASIEEARMHRSIRSKRDRAPSRAGTEGLLSARSLLSVLSIGSAGSILSIGSAGSGPRAEPEESEPDEG